MMTTGFDTKTITFHATEDGYMLGAASAEIARDNPRYWHPFGCEFDNCTIETVELFAASDDDIRGFEAQGTRDQEWADGYEAMQALNGRIVR